ncbi:MAG: UDP-3-O-(3-hydroxymyristoyl)glucosamine N-acyltransferase [Bacteroidetes bacterium]|nr:UDP-3-O-(3-hydroxymyristoyl)glucosamine N-acyltransferase [Bacteroidota bacterium]
MRFEKPVPIAELAVLLQATLVGDKTAYVTGINEIHKVQKGDLVFVDHPKYYEKCLRSAATCIIINQEVPVPPGKSLLVVTDPFAAYLSLVDTYRPFTPSLVPVSETAVIGEDTIVMPGAYIGNHVTIGKNCIIHPQVTILDHCHLGDGVIIQAGSVIGSDAFYYNRKTALPVQYRKMKSCGRVLIEDQVEIGAGCTIDRGVTADTLIGTGTKIDNQVHIGHDCVIGRNCLIAAQVGLAGAVTLEDEVVLWGQVGVNKTLTIGKGAIVFGQSGVASTIAGEKTYWGTPAIDFNEKKRELVWVKRIPSLWEKLKSLIR